ncbi:hypothetical protein CF15_05370 [Pyrodictium occultum]|uniref:Major facilitator superfamily (MFS) profile domain-containing protein n=1 Tax=Pyrodictium occultum TaxID=2309 RepID=A0A0V8RVV4_PYROC|nr:MFS transporter [Pyrodictium occultum]KSW12191.1 hypothetical protein CF15_05370 [Pyrodictium occultum]
MAGLYALLVAVLLFFTSISSLGSIVSRYMRDLGAGVAVSGQVYAVAPLVAAILRIPVGIAADRVGSRLFLVAGAAVAAAAGLLAAAAAGAAALAAARGLQGAALAFFVAPSIAAAAALGGEMAVRAISLRAAAVSAAMVLGPMLAGVVADHAGSRAAFLLSAAAGASAAAAAAWVRMSSRPVFGGPSPGLRDALTPGVALAVALAVVDGMGFFAVQSLSQMSLRDLGYGASVSGAFQSILAASGLAARGLSSRVYAKLGPRRMLAMGFALEALGLSLLASRPEPPTAYLAAALQGFGSGTSIPGEQILVSISAPRGAGNRAASLYTLGFDVGGALGVFALSGLAGSAGYAAAYTAAAAAAVAAGTLSLAAGGRLQRPRGKV